MNDYAHELGFHKPIDDDCQWQNDLSKTQKLMLVAVTNYRGLKVIASPGCAPLTGSTTIHGPMDQKWWRSTGQILDANFFRRFPLTPVEFGPQTKAIGYLMKLSFQPKPLVILWNYLSIHIDSRRWLFSMIPIDSCRIWASNQSHWLSYEIIFPSICGSSKTESGCILGVHFNADWS